MRIHVVIQKLGGLALGAAGVEAEHGAGPRDEELLPSGAGPILEESEELLPSGAGPMEESEDLLASGAGPKDEDLLPSGAGPKEVSGADLASGAGPKDPGADLPSGAGPRAKEDRAEDDTFDPLLYFSCNFKT